MNQLNNNELRFRGHGQVNAAPQGLINPDVKVSPKSWYQSILDCFFGAQQQQPSQAIQGPAVRINNNNNLGVPAPLVPPSPETEELLTIPSIAVRRAGSENTPSFIHNLRQFRKDETVQDLLNAVADKLGESPNSLIMQWGVLPIEPENMHVKITDYFGKDLSSINHLSCVIPPARHISCG